MLTPNDLNQEPGKVIKVETTQIDHLQSAKDYLQIAISGDAGVERTDPRYWLKLAEVSALISIAIDMRPPVVMGERAGRPGLTWQEIQRNDGSRPDALLSDLKVALVLLARIRCEISECDECHQADVRKRKLLEKYKHLLDG